MIITSITLDWLVKFDIAALLATCCASCGVLNRIVA